jgi:hypothetical protein
MSQENSLNMMDKYFQPQRITQIIGESNSLKDSFVSIYIAHKLIRTSSKAIFICSKPTLNIRYIYETHKNAEKDKFSPEKVEKQYLFFEFIKYESMGEFLLKNLPILLEKEKTVSTIVINNLNNFFSTTSYKYMHDHRIFGIQLLNLAKTYNLNIIYLNDFFYYCETKFLNNRNNINYMDPNNPNNQNFMYDKKNINEERTVDGDGDGDINMKDENTGNEEEENDNNEIEDYYNREPINNDILAEFCSHILIAENKKSKMQFANFITDDFMEQGIFRVTKSNYKPHLQYLVTINKNNFSYNIEIV